MLATVLLATLRLLQSNLFWLLGELKVFTSCEGLLFHAYGVFVGRENGFAKPPEALRRVMDQRELTAEILSL